MGAAPSPLFRPRPFPSEGKLLLSRRYPPGGHPRTLCHQSIRPRALFLATSEENQVLGSWRAIPRTSARASYRGTSDSCRDTPETLIRRPMIAGPPIEGNLDCRDRSFHSETYFDIEALKQQPRAPRFIPTAAEGVVLILSQSDMVRILSRGTSTASVLTRRELPSGMLLIDVLLRATYSPFSIRKSSEELQRADGIPLLFPRLLCQILEHLGYPEEPRLERRPLAERTSLSDKWHHLVAYFAPREPHLCLHLQSYPEMSRYLSQQDEILTETPPPAPAAHPSEHIPELYIYFSYHFGCSTSHAANPAPPPSSEPTITVSLAEFRGLVRSLQTLSTAHDSIIHQMALFVHTRIRSLLLKLSIPRSFIRFNSI
ncbi:hypothetical protein CK203_029585 [Vitis vinifera]|uniref:Uncharacterized protein n=1 Tax=Vitis vinifera TaxID=29760 RepID=A0A438JCC0_VITVI|nr:hypothetical protein CK203_029585 [Vitis vinifera]